MPVSGLPDPEQHWRCARCEQWFEADEGSLSERQRFSYSGQIADNIRGGGKLQFRCDPCAARHARNLRMFWIIGGAIFLIGLAWNLWQERQ